MKREIIICLTFLILLSFITTVIALTETYTIYCGSFSCKIVDGVGPFYIKDYINRNITNLHLGYTPASHAYNFDDDTAKKICNIAGYTNVASYSCKCDPADYGACYDNRCNYYSCGGEILSKWDASINNFKQIGACGNKWISKITCTRETCVPDCTNKECGGDGCGGSCGDCNYCTTNPDPINSGDNITSFTSWTEVYSGSTGPLTSTSCCDNSERTCPGADCCDGFYYPDNLTATKICQMKGYDSQISYTIDPATAFSCGDNYFLKWNGVSFENICLCSENFNEGINGITCKKSNICYPNCIGKRPTDSDGCGGTCSSCLVEKKCIVNECVINTNCFENQTIIKLSDSTNALGGLWNSSIGYSICYNKIFGYDFINDSVSVSHPQNCSNPILWLNSTNNAYASTVESTKYNIPVCFGNMSCRAINLGESCSIEEKVVVKLNSLTESLIFNSGDINFPIQICCKNYTKKIFSLNAAWQDMIGNNISTADLADTVKLTVFREDLIDKNINYTVYKKKACTYSGNIWEYINDCFNIFKGDTKEATLSGIGFTTLKLNSSGEYYFQAKVIGSEEVIGSNVLSVSTPSNNYPPITKIAKPVENNTFILKRIDNKTNPISLEQISIDIDDDLNGIWNFEDGNVTLVKNCLTTGNCNNSHVYNSSGVKTIQFNVEETTRNQATTDNTRIYVYRDGLNLFVLINSPNYKQKIVDAGLVYMDGRDTFIANCTIDQTECNLANKGAGNCYEVVDDVSSSLNTWCYVYAEAASDSKFKFKWKFDGVEDTQHIDAAPFNHPFLDAKEHIINLKVSYDIIE